MLDHFNSNSSFIFNESKKSFDDLLKDIYCFSKHLKSQDIDIFTTNSYLFMVAFFGAILNKSRPYLLSYNLPNNDRVFFDDDAISAVLSSNCGTFDINFMKLDLDSVFFIQTSGSSGDSKNIEKTINQMILESAFLTNHFDIKSDSIIISSISHQYLFGLTFKIFVALKSGANIHCQELNYPELVSASISNLKNHKIIFLSSPVLLDCLSKKNNIDEFNNIATIFTAGSKLDKHTRENLNKLIKSQIIEIYGSSETGVFASNIDGNFVAFPSVKISIDDKSRLIVSSPWQKIGDKSEFLSNDCVEIKGDRLKILGRFDRIIKLHDKRVSLDFLENTIKKSSIIEDIAISQDNRYKRLAAILVLNKEGKKLFRNKGKKEIVKQIKTLITKEFNSKLRYFYIRSKLPKNTNGKLPKSAFLDSINARIKPEFKLISKDLDSIKLSAYIDEGSFYFEGHFLDFPLVPGFIQLGFVLDSIKKHLGFGYENIQQIEAIKFMNFLRPCDEAILEIKTIENKISFKIFANNKECANGRLRIHI